MKTLLWHHPSARTAISRNTYSRPISRAIRDQVISPGTSVFDYGQGRGDDVRKLQEQGYSAQGWDPYHNHLGIKTPADVVNLGFVLNVIEDPEERRAALLESFGLARQVLIVSVRTDKPRLKNPQHRGDGVITCHGSFQKFYTQNDARQYLYIETGVIPQPVDSGIFYLFKCDLAKSRYHLHTGR